MNLTNMTLMLVKFLGNLGKHKIFSQVMPSPFVLLYFFFCFPLEFCKGCHFGTWGQINNKSLWHFIRASCWFFSLLWGCFTWYSSFPLCLSLRISNAAWPNHYIFVFSLSHVVLLGKVSYLAGSPPPGGKFLMSSLDRQCMV